MFHIPVVSELVDETVNCVYVSADGDIEVECSGGDCIPPSAPGDLVLFQRGLKCPKDVKRSSTGVFSPFRLGERGVFVPWTNVAWVSPSLDVTRHGLSRCVTCLSDTTVPPCLDCFEALTLNRVVVLRLKQTDGDYVFQWYTVFCGRVRALSRVPSPAARSVLLQTNGYVCRCGQGCPHPLSRMWNSRSEQHALEFENRACKLFCERKRCTRDCVAVERLSQRGRFEGRVGADDGCTGADGECVVCLESTRVSTALCVNRTCRVAICSDCSVATRGLCVICQRSKMLGDARYWCYSCRRAVDLPNFGFECARCCENKICSTCHSSYSLCRDCESEVLFDDPVDSAARIEKRARAA